MTAAFVFYGFTWQGLAAALWGLILSQLSLADIYTMTAPYGLVLVLAFISSLCLMVSPEFSWFNSLIGMFVISAPMFILSLFYPRGMGGGDVIFLAITGFVLGWRLSILGAIISIIAGGIYGIYLLNRNWDNLSRRIPFLPFWSLGTYIAFLGGYSIIEWYLSIF